MFTPAAVLCLHWVQQGCARAGGALKAACKVFCDANLWQTPQGRTCRWKYSEKLSCSYLEFKRLKKQLWEKRGIFSKKETLKGLGGFFSQLLLGDSCCSAIFFLCLVLMSSGFFSLNFIYSCWAWAENSWCCWKLVVEGAGDAEGLVGVLIWQVFHYLISGIFSVKDLRLIRQIHHSLGTGKPVWKI